MPTFVLTDVAHDVWEESLAVDAAGLGLDATTGWSVVKKRLRGGRRDGVDLIVVDNGALRFSVIPTRGMGLWKGFYEGNFLGWESPITDGPVHPGFVDLSSRGGLGWLDGYDEWMSRCGLENNGAPFEVVGSNGDRTPFGLHGRIANTPASYVAVHIDPEPPYEICIEGRVIEAWLFGMQVALETRMSTVPGSNAIVIRDTFVNLQERPAEMQILYHCNFGPPFLEEGSRFVAPFETVCPRDGTAQAAFEQHDVYEGPTPGFAEQVFFYDLRPADGGDGRTVAMLRNRGRDRGVVLRYSKEQLPAFTLWKNTAGLRDGYVTGLEPASNFPNARPFEKARNRVVTLPVGGSHSVELRIEVVTSADAVTAVEREVAAIQSRGSGKVYDRPTEPFAPEG